MNKIHISKITKEKETLNRKLDTILCGILSKSIIYFLYYSFTSLCKGKTYLEEKILLSKNKNIKR